MSKILVASNLKLDTFRWILGSDDGEMFLMWSYFGQKKINSCFLKFLLRAHTRLIRCFSSCLLVVPGWTTLNYRSSSRLGIRPGVRTIHRPAAGQPVAHPWCKSPIPLHLNGSPFESGGCWGTESSLSRSRKAFSGDLSFVAGCFLLLRVWIRKPKRGRARLWRFKKPRLVLRRPKFC